MVTFLCLIGLLVLGQDAKPRVEHVLFPAARGYWWRYTGTAGREAVEVRVIVRDVRRERDGIRVSTIVPGVSRSVPEEGYLITPGQVARTVGIMSGISFEPPLPIIRSPIAVGRKWIWKGAIEPRQSKRWSASGYAVVEVKGRENVETPAGKFQAYRVDMTVAVRVENERFETSTKYWFAPYVGMVRQVGTRLDSRKMPVAVDLRLAEYSLQEMAPSKGSYRIGRMTD